MGTAAQALRAYERAGSWEEAEAALDALAESREGVEAGVGDLFDELASAAADAGEPGRAARLEQKALLHGCAQPRLARQMLGWYLLDDGQRVAGEAQFAALLAEGGEDDVEVLLALGAARVSAGHDAEGLQALDGALAAARAHGDPAELRQARAERREAREALGLLPDEDDLLAPPRAAELLGVAPPPSAGPPVEHAAPPEALAWFPRDEHAAAAARWPGPADADAAAVQAEHALREMARETGRPPRIAALRVAELVALAEREGLDPGTAEARARLAAELAREGRTLPWPPGRNDPCWCGSGRKYKRCCGAA
jgi:hypothetical protein